MIGAHDHLHFNPSQLMTRGDAAEVTAKLLRLSHPTNLQLVAAGVDENDPHLPQIAKCLCLKLFTLKADGRFHPYDPLSANDLSSLSKHRLIHQEYSDLTEKPVTRSEFASFIYPIAAKKRHREQDLSAL